MLTHGSRQVAAWLIFDVRQNMKWIYLSIAAFAAIMFPIVAFFGDPDQRARGLRICVTAFVVNFALFYAIRWAQKKRSREAKHARS